jgi:O-antigen/teichoic acid export membrane protein
VPALPDTGPLHSADAELPGVSTAMQFEEGIGFGVDPDASPRSSLPRAGLIVAPAMGVANLLGYAFNLVMSRVLGPSSYGELGALLGVALIAGVPALALQPVVARHAATSRSARSDAGGRRYAVRVAVALAVALTATAPVIAAFLHLKSFSPLLWLAAAMATQPLVAAYQGVLQGHERFGRLAALFVAGAALRLSCAVALVAAGYGVAGALAGTAAGSLLTAGLGELLIRPLRHDPAPPAGFSRDLWHATVTLLGLLVMANVDVLLARHHLTARDAGMYAVGAVLAKGAFWAPQFVVVLVFPRLTDPAQRDRVLKRSLLFVGGLGACAVAATAGLAHRGLDVVVGGAYTDLATWAWLFAAVGGTLAVAQLLLFSGLAASNRRVAVAVTVVVLGEIAVIEAAMHDSVGQIVVAALGGAVALVAAGVVLQRRPARA